ncbi:uncharacterized protein LOC118437206 [Folsomia candida]|uniref:uncharacterized protein LOC118437206 n=1 Tax=Folsomia candida TaxID=158441 RepID=UPI001604D696|nr:uncharacterized protein LOC118437206 [Folsomia candida]
MEARFMSMRLVIVFLGVFHLFPAIYPKTTTTPTKINGNDIFTKLWTSLDLTKYSSQLQNRNGTLPQLKMPDAEFFIKYGNSLARTGVGREGRYYLRRAEFRRDPRHDQMEKFLLTYFISNEYTHLMGNPMRGDMFEIISLAGSIVDFWGGIPEDRCAG